MGEAVTEYILSGTSNRKLITSKLYETIECLSETLIDSLEGE